MADDKSIKIWAHALEEAMWCIPGDIRERILCALLEEERSRKPFRVFCFSELKELDAEDCDNYCATKEAVAVMVQVLTRAITNSNSKEGAARLLFRDHYGYGTGSGWLPDYLDGLPGIAVDKNRCAAIADSSGPSRLRSTP